MYYKLNEDDRHDRKNYFDCTSLLLFLLIIRLLFLLLRQGQTVRDG